eukprot:TRINITY_DN37299_c0_g1_i1.p1 TRINITY_DN37299_c0_g1~~TRINITY_DN37299_c0_g1_i1.p1  ORF type:complete len:311 (-),score=71.65 TRINITY_DN37299_c0_g1_i1:17-949(-)
MPPDEGHGVDETVRENCYEAAALNQQDLDRNFCLPTSQLFKWMQAARMDMPWMQSGYRALALLEPKMVRRLLVASQVVRLIRPGVLSEAASQNVTTRCEVGEVGRTSIEFRYTIFFGEQLVANAATIMIVTAGSPGNFKPSPVPDAVRRLASRANGEARQFMAEALSDVPREPPHDSWRMPLEVRFSDEDVNRHANHSAMARYFEDAREALLADESTVSLALRSVAEQQLEAVMVAYLAEARAQDVCEVHVARASGAASALNLWAVRLKPNRAGGVPGILARGRLQLGGGKGATPEELRMRGPSVPQAKL